MTEISTITFAKSGRTPKGILVVLAGEGLTLGSRTKALGLDGLVRRAAKAADFTGKSMKALDILAPADAKLDRLIVVGVGKAAEVGEHDWLRLGGVAMGALAKGTNATVLLERPDGVALDPGSAADFALGLALRSYSFDKYKPSKDGNGNSLAKPPPAVTVLVEDLTRVKSAWSARSAAAAGVTAARDLVNEPANVLGPVEFAREAAALKSLGVVVEVLIE